MTDNGDLAEPIRARRLPETVLQTATHGQVPPGEPGRG